MKSKYDSIKTAQELVKEVAMNGISRKEEDICRMQDIFGHSDIEELKELATGRDYGMFYFIIFEIWSWEDAVRFWNETSNRELESIKKLRDKLLNQVELLQKSKSELEKRVNDAIDDAIEAQGHESDMAEKLKAKDLEILRLKAKLFDMMEAKSA